MLDKQKQILEENLNYVTSKLESLYPRVDEVKKNIANSEKTLSLYYASCSSRNFLKTIWKVMPPFVGVLEIILFFVPENALIDYEQKMSIMLYVLPISYILMASFLSFRAIPDIRAFKKTRDFNEEELREEISKAKELLERLSNQIANLETRKTSISNEICYIEEMPKKISEILDNSTNLTSKFASSPNIEEILLSDFEDFLNERVDYSKFHLTDVGDIKEYKLKK